MSQLACQHSHPFSPSYSPPQALLILSLLRFGLSTLFLLPGHLEFVWQTALPHSAHKLNCIHTHTCVYITRHCKWENTMCKLYSVPPIPTIKPSCIWPTTTLRHCNHLCYFWPIVFDVMMEENHAFKTQGKGTTWVQGREGGSHNLQKKKRKHCVLGLSKPLFKH